MALQLTANAQGDEQSRSVSGKEKNLHMSNWGCLLSLLGYFKISTYGDLFHWDSFLEFPRMRCPEIIGNKDAYILIATTSRDLFNKQNTTNNTVGLCRWLRIRLFKYHCDITPTLAKLPAKSRHGFDIISGKLLKRKHERGQGTIKRRKDSYQRI